MSGAWVAEAFTAAAMRSASKAAAATLASREPVSESRVPERRLAAGVLPEELSARGSAPAARRRRAHSAEPRWWEPAAQRWSAVFP